MRKIGEKLKPFVIPILFFLLVFSVLTIRTYKMSWNFQQRAGVVLCL
jgi:hypothetical protein